MKCWQIVSIHFLQWTYLYDCHAILNKYEFHLEYLPQQKEYQFCCFFYQIIVNFDQEAIKV